MKRIASFPLAIGLGLAVCSAAAIAMPTKLVCEQLAGGETDYQWDADAGTLNGRRDGQREPYGSGSYQQYFVNANSLGRGVYTDGGKLVYEFRINRSDGKYLFWDPNSNPEPTLIGRCAPLASADASKQRGVR